MAALFFNGCPLIAHLRGWSPSKLNLKRASKKKYPLQARLNQWYLRMVLRVFHVEHYY